MADYTFFTSPMSRGQIVRWALHEVDADYEQVLVSWDNKPSALLAANPMGKVPTIIHNTANGDRVVTEAPAICAYLAEMHPNAGLLPTDEEKADYFRWMFFAAGPIEQAITSKSFGFEPTPQQEGMAGFGSLDRTVAAITSHLADRNFVCGSRFTMADVYVGASVGWGLAFGALPANDALTAYSARCEARPARQAAKAIDDALIAESRK
ncbi:MAG: glutathione S-transferase family protein [Novosphingobium sp.]